MICKKCNQEIPEDSKVCPFCGQTTENNEKEEKTKGFKRKRILAVGIGMVCIISGILFCYFKIYKGSFKVEQVQDTFELGSEQKLLNSLKYNYKTIRDIEIVNDGGFSTDEMGDYEVVIDVINDRGNHKKFNLNYHVVDTVAPTVKIQEETVYIPKNEEFNLEEYVTAEDLSGSCTVDYTGDLNTEVEGTYSISVFATDSSGNTSDGQEVTVIVENRENCDVGDVNFGETKEMVKRYVKDDLLEESDNWLLYYSALNGIDSNAAYYFNSQGQLYEVIHNLGVDIINHDAYIQKYDSLVAALKEKYGEPSNTETVNNSPINLDAGTALWLGYYGRGDEWDLEKFKIITKLYSDESNETTFLCGYISNEYTQ